MIWCKMFTFRKNYFLLLFFTVIFLVMTILLQLLKTCLYKQRYARSYLKDKPLKVPTYKKKSFVFLNSSFYCDSRTSKLADRKILWTVFAGRRENLKIQEKYWHILKRKKLISEVHLWDFTYRNINKKEALLNKEWIHNKAKKYKFIHTISRPGFLWSTYYKHYAQYADNDSIILKVDDDIVWLNISEFKCFVNFVHESTNIFLVSANIINSGTIAYFQQLLGSFPRSLWNLTYPEGGEHGKLSNNAQIGFELHKYFLSHKSNFYKDSIIQFMERLNINFVAFRSEKSKEINKYAYFDVKYQGAIDEVGLTRYAIQVFKKIEVVYMRFVVAHLAFGRQLQQNQTLVQKTLNLYQEIKNVIQ